MVVSANNLYKSTHPQEGSKLQKLSFSFLPAPFRKAAILSCCCSHCKMGCAICSSHDFTSHDISAIALIKMVEQMAKAEANFQQNTDTQSITS